MSEIIQNIKLKARILELEAELAGLHSILNDPVAIMKQKQLIEHLEECNAGQSTHVAELEIKLDNAMTEANDLRQALQGKCVDSQILKAWESQSFLPECKHQRHTGTVTYCTDTGCKLFDSPCSKRCDCPEPEDKEIEDE